MTQTDEVRRALVVICNANGLLDGDDVWEGELAKASSVLSAEIERLTRRVEELTPKSAATPAARWREEGKPDPHGNRYDCERARLCGGQYTDDEVAFRVAMLMRDDLNHEAVLSMAKDRIRWLSRALASATAPDERVLTEREQYTVGELLTCRTFDYPRVMTEAHAIIQRLVSARTPDQTEESSPTPTDPAKQETHSTFGTLAGLQKRIADEPDDMMINILAGEIRGIIAMLPARAASPTPATPPETTVTEAMVEAAIRALWGTAKVDDEDRADMRATIQAALTVKEPA